MNNVKQKLIMIAEILKLSKSVSFFLKEGLKLNTIDD